MQATKLGLAYRAGAMFSGNLGVRGYAASAMVERMPATVVRCISRI